MGASFTKASLLGGPLGERRELSCSLRERSEYRGSLFRGLFLAILTGD